MYVFIVFNITQMKKGGEPRLQQKNSPKNSFLNDANLSDIYKLLELIGIWS